ncbi:UDP-N-acetylmuramoyl-L-alanine--D-glutamate ligase [Synechococcus sp. M16CYN]|uniref:UDP-N-acetylmuramoyl-L-alanine--D-glutamate ligase n=1 Tax=Synechococcus sp. M16CYN TaxID=3103139 RepID=UPI0032436A25
MAFTVVVGLGKSGIGAARLMHNQGQSVAVIEQEDGPEHRLCANQLQKQGIQVELGCPLEISSFVPWRNSLSAVVVGPGIPWDHPTLTALRRGGIQVRGEIDLAWSALNTIPWVGITGTNGKTTVTHLLSHILQRAGIKAPMGGNMGVSAAEIALEITTERKSKPDWLIMELSSYQIESAPTLAPQIGIWTNLTPDHLERHRTLEAYGSIKRGLLERSGLAIFNGDDPYLRSYRKFPGSGLWISSEEPHSELDPVDFWIDAEGTVHMRDIGAMFTADVLAMPGVHNRQNLLLATAAAIKIGLNPAEIALGLKSFPGLPHRLEQLGLLATASVFNDSKATNYDAASVGLKAISGPVVVLAGGQIKRGDAGCWLAQLKSKACSVILYGAGAGELEVLIRYSGYIGDLHRCSDLNEAVPISVQATINHNAASLLLSPACASLDQYKDFEARGNHFRRLIQPYLLAS